MGKWGRGVKSGGGGREKRREEAETKLTTEITNKKPESLHYG